MTYLEDGWARGLETLTTVTLPNQMMPRPRANLPSAIRDTGWSIVVALFVNQALTNQSTYVIHFYMEINQKQIKQVSKVQRMYNKLSKEAEETKRPSDCFTNGRTNTIRPTSLL